jgi:hypothetical protein
MRIILLLNKLNPNIFFLFERGEHKVFFTRNKVYEYSKKYLTSSYGRKSECFSDSREQYIQGWK